MSFPTIHELQNALRGNNVAYNKHLLLKYTQLHNASQKIEKNSIVVVERVNDIFKLCYLFLSYILYETKFFNNIDIAAST